MAEDPDKRGTRSIERIPFGRSPSTPTASSAGASFMPLQGNMTSIDWLGKGQASKKLSLSGASVGLPRPAASTNTAGASTTCSRKSVCRPWDREDLLMRLSSFNSYSWSKKAKAGTPMDCARRGWVNVELDVISCDSCGAQVNFSTAVSSAHEQAENVGDTFRKELENAHQAFCPWRGNICADGLVQFPPTPVPALVGGYNDRFEAMLQLPYLPVVSEASIHHLKLSRGLQISRLLEQSPPLPGRLMAGNEVERMVTGPFEDCIYGSSNSFYKSLRLLSLCGWETRVLPDLPDREDHSAHSARNICSAGPSKIAAHKIQGSTPNVVTRGRKENQNNEKKTRLTNRTNRTFRPSHVSTFLDCSLCGASFSLSGFGKVFRPFTALDAAFQNLPQSDKQYAETPARGASATSGIDGWFVTDSKGKVSAEHMSEAGQACPTTEHDTPSNVGLLTLGVTAEGPSSTVLDSQTMALSRHEAMAEMQALSEQAEGSEMGEHGAASYESRGPVDPHYQGVSSICIPTNRTLLEASANVDHGTDDGEAKSFAAESSKRKHTADSSPVDQFSLGIAVTDPGSRNEGTYEPDVDCEVQGKLKKKLVHQWSSLQSCSDMPAAIFSGTNSEMPESSRGRDRPNEQGNFREGHSSRPSGNDLPCSSSVNATYTCYFNAKENSAESVEYMPNSSVLNHNTGSADFEFEGYIDKPNIAHTQNCTSRPMNSARAMSVTSHRFPSNNKLGEELEETNIAVISSDTAVAGGISVGMAVVNDQHCSGVDAREESVIADVSVHQAESAGGDAEVVVGNMGDFTPGDGLPIGVDRARRTDTQDDSREAMLFGSLSRQTSHKEVASAEGEWGETGVKANQRESGKSYIEGTQGTIVAAITGGEAMTLPREGSDVSIKAINADNEQAGTNSAAIIGEEREATDAHFSGKGTTDFDPVFQHRHFCPWVNGNVVAAGSNGSDFGATEALCGWQLTVDALEVLQMQANMHGGATESESTASMCKFVSDQQTPRSLSPRQQFSACGR